MKKKEHMNVQEVLKKLRKEFPNPGAMELGNPYHTLVGVILSARTRDEQVLKLLPEFWKAFPTVDVLAHATPKQIEQKINTIGIYKQKAKNLQKMAESVVKNFSGKIPSTMNELVSLSGVGRKTASVLLVASFGQSAIAVDTHVHRVTNRLGWVKTNTPQKTEEILLKMIPSKNQPLVNRVFVKLGRYICLPGKPRCWACPVVVQCAYRQKQLTRPKNAEEILSDIDRREKIVETLRQNAL